MRPAPDCCAVGYAPTPSRNTIESGAMDWIRWTQRLQAIAQTGLAYSTGPYDLGRYEELRVLAIELAAAQLQRPTAEVATLIAAEVGYPTPKVDVRAVVFDREGRLLFVREREEQLWSLPGGWA